MEVFTGSPRMAWGLGEVAEFTGLSLAFLRLEVRAGRLAVRKFGRRILVSDEALRSYLAEGSPGNKATMRNSKSDKQGGS
jgi:hypothetical protein